MVPAFRKCRSPPHASQLSLPCDDRDLRPLYTLLARQHNTGLDHEVGILSGRRESEIFFFNLNLKAAFCLFCCIRNKLYRIFTEGRYICQIDPTYRYIMTIDVTYQVLPEVRHDFILQNCNIMMKFDADYVSAGIFNFWYTL